MAKITKFSSAWDEFVSTVTKSNRYLFFDEKIPSKVDKTFGELFTLLSSLAESLKLIRTISGEDKLFRARIITNKVDCKSMWPPPMEKAVAGRMNPAGISYFYLALERATAVAETMDRPPRKMAVAEFVPEKELMLLNLTELSEKLENVGDDKPDTKKALGFFKYFAESICRPIVRDGLEHVDYVPSQIACEYFSHKFTLKSGRRVDGLLYPSAIRPGGSNIVLFPRNGDGESYTSLVKCQENVELLVFDTWRDFITRIT